MGGAVSSRHGSYEYTDYINQIKPSYYVEDVVLTDDDINLAKTSWDLIVSEQNTEPFRERKLQNSPDFQYSSSLTWFFDAFYNKFFELCPEAKIMFVHTTLQAQGRLIAGVISSALNAVNDPLKLKLRMESNTEKHNQVGIKAYTYGVMGYALVDTLELIVGPTFDDATKTAWIRVYCFMLNIILPIAVRHEVKVLNDIQHENSSHHSENSVNSTSGMWTGRRLDSFIHMDQFVKRKTSSSRISQYEMRSPYGDSSTSIGSGMGSVTENKSLKLESPKHSLINNNSNNHYSNGTTHDNTTANNNQSSVTGGDTPHLPTIQSLPDLAQQVELSPVPDRKHLEVSQRQIEEKSDYFVSYLSTSDNDENTNANTDDSSNPPSMKSGKATAVPPTSAPVDQSNMAVTGKDTSSQMNGGGHSSESPVALKSVPRPTSSSSLLRSQQSPSFKSKLKDYELEPTVSIVLEKKESQRIIREKSRKILHQIEEVEIPSSRPIEEHQP